MLASKLIKIIFNSLLIIIIIILGTYLALRLSDKIRIYNVATGSMEDKIHTGDYILLVKKNDYKVNDVVTYTVDNYFITHRIIKMENDKITTKGDANNLEDKEISKNQIIGKVIYCGGILNFVINYKYVIVAFMIGLYLLSCYFGNDKIQDEKEIEELIEENLEDNKKNSLKKKKETKKSK